MIGGAKKPSLLIESRKANESSTSTPFVFIGTKRRSIFRSPSRQFETPVERLSERPKLLATSPNVNERSESCEKAKNVIECWRMHSILKCSSVPESLREETRNYATSRGISWSLRK